MGWVTSGNPLPYLSGRSWLWSWDGRIFFGAWRLCWSFGESHSFSLRRNSPKTVRPSGLGAMLQILSRERLSWVLSLFYFLTFGGFVAFSIYLPVLLKDQFGLKPADAGFRTAGFVVLATLARPLGGWLSDKIGGARVLQTVFLGIIPFALLMSWPAMLPFTVGALGCAFLLGIGNGAVFKLVPQYFPKEVGTVTGLVGAMGGLGGFFPPLLLGFFRDHLHTVWPGFALLAFLSAVLWRTNAAVFLTRQQTAELTLPASSDPDSGPHSSGRHGHTLHWLAGSRHRCRLAQPPKL